jgi:uncharacterized protein (DUF169 family)
MENLGDYKKAGNELHEKLRLATFPVGVTYIKSEHEIPQGAYRPSAGGGKLSLCQAFTLARRWGMSVAMTSKDNFCTPATAIHGWEDVSFDDLVESQVRQGWHKGREAEIKRLSPILPLAAGERKNLKNDYTGFVCSPLTAPATIPDSVIIYCDGVQLTHLVHALSYEYAHVPTSSFEGFAESCVKGGWLPFVTQRPQVVIPGAGDRSFAAIQDHELALGIPAGLVSYVLENLFKTGGSMNIGLPVRPVMAMNLNEHITPGFKFLREKMEK